MWGRTGISHCCIWAKWLHLYSYGSHRCLVKGAGGQISEVGPFLGAISHIVGSAWSSSLWVRGFLFSCLTPCSAALISYNIAGRLQISYTKESCPVASLPVLTSWDQVPDTSLHSNLPVRGQWDTQGPQSGLHIWEYVDRSIMRHYWKIHRIAICDF